MFSPDLAGGRKDYDPWEGVSTYSRLTYPHNKGQFYDVNLPRGLKAFHEYRISGYAQDEFGRRLNKPIDFRFKTSHRPRNYVRKYFHSVLESQVGNDVPIYVTNLDSLTLHYDKTGVGKAQSGSRDVELENILDVAYGVGAGISQILGGKDGMVVATD